MQTQSIAICFRVKFCAIISREAFAECRLDPSSERGRVCGVHWQWCHSPPHPPHIANGVTYGGAQIGQGSAWGNRTSPCKSSWGFQWQCLTSGSRQWQGKQGKWQLKLGSNCNQWGLKCPGKLLHRLNHSRSKRESPV